LHSSNDARRFNLSKRKKIQMRPPYPHESRRYQPLAAARCAVRASADRGAEAMQTAQYLKQVATQDHFGCRGNRHPQSIENAGPAYLRDRAAHYRQLAKQQYDPRRAQLLLDLAASSERYAMVKERRPGKS
jgi:hypothetical protein